MHRRELIGTALAFGAMQAMPRPRTFNRIEACTPETGIVDWSPDVLHPVSYGFRDYGSGEAGAPMSLRIFYPSYLNTGEGAGNSAPLLKRCDVRWPLVLFLHGRPPCDPGGEVPGYNRRWSRFGSVLAKSGYVVVVPNRDADLPTFDDPAIAQAARVIDWVRGVQVDSTHPGAAAARTLGPLQTRRWEHADWVHPRATAIAGHSWGALLAAHVARTRPTSSFVSLEGGFPELPDPTPLLRSVSAAKLFMWAKGGQAELDGANGGSFGAIPAPKYSAVYTGDHFDFVRTGAGCDEAVGNCAPQIRAFAPDLVALFIARNTPVGASPVGIPVSLIPPDAPLSDKQQSFARGHLHSLIQSGCPVTLRWNTPEGSGSRIQGG